MVGASRLAGHGRGQIVGEQVGWILCVTTDVAKQFPDAAEVGKKPNESVSVEQRQLLRAAEPDQCVLEVKAKPIPEMLTQRQICSRAHTITAGFLVFSMCVERKLMIGIGDDRTSELEEASGDHVEIADEDGMVNSRLRFKVLMNQNDGSVAAMEGPKDVTENMVRVVCGWLETWRFGECTLKCQNGTAEITSKNAVDRTRRVETSLRNASRYLHNRVTGNLSSNKQKNRYV